MGGRQDLRLNIRSSIFCLLNKVLEENNFHKSTFIQQAMIEKMMFSKAFRNEVISTLEQNRDIDYYDALSAFKKLDAIQKDYQDAAKKIVKIVYNRIKL